MSNNTVHPFVWTSPDSVSEASGSVVLGKDGNILVISIQAKGVTLPSEEYVRFDLNNDNISFVADPTNPSSSSSPPTIAMSRLAVSLRESVVHNGDGEIVAASDACTIMSAKGSFPDNFNWAIYVRSQTEDVSMGTLNMLFNNDYKLDKSIRNSAGFVDVSQKRREQAMAIAAAHEAAAAAKAAALEAESLRQHQQQQQANAQSTRKQRQQTPTTTASQASPSASDMMSAFATFAMCAPTPVTLPPQKKTRVINRMGTTPSHQSPSMFKKEEPVVSAPAAAPSSTLPTNAQQIISKATITPNKKKPAATAASKKGKKKVIVQTPVLFEYQVAKHIMNDGKISYSLDPESDFAQEIDIVIQANAITSGKSDQVWAEKMRPKMDAGQQQSVEFNLASTSLCQIDQANPAPKFPTLVVPNGYQIVADVDLVTVSGQVIKGKATLSMPMIMYSDIYSLNWKTPLLIEYSSTEAIDSFKVKFEGMPVSQTLVPNGSVTIN